MTNTEFGERSLEEHVVMVIMIMVGVFIVVASVKLLSLAAGAMV